MPRLSVIIPTLNETTHLPGLLNALRRQTRPPDEIIIADAESSDDTRELARKRGASVVHGGIPAVGRNAGARTAMGDLFLFLDPGVLPAHDLLTRALDEFTHAGYAAATCLIETASADPTDRFIVAATNLYLHVVRATHPYAPSFFILARREVHQAIGGFDESPLSQDHNYAQRAMRCGEFGILNGVHIPVSMPRLEKEGLVQLSLKYLWCEIHALAGKPVKSDPFAYEVDGRSSAAPTTGYTLLDIAELRSQLGRFENPLQQLSNRSLKQLKRLVEFDPVDAANVGLSLLLAPADLQLLDRYLQQRLALAQRNARPQRGQASKPLKPPREPLCLLVTE